MRRIPLPFRVAGCLLAFTSLAGAQATPPSRAQLVGRLDSLARAWIASAPAAGATVAVVKGSDTLLLQAYGERNRETHVPATTGTVYRIGSVTKQFTSAAIMQLVEQGRMALTDPVTKYLPQYPQWSGVTIRHLLNHTSGIHSYTSNRSWADTWAQELTPAQIVAFVEKDTLDFSTGAGWRYNNTGYVLLGMVLEKVTGQPYAEYMRSRFFTPLGMRSASYCPTTPTDSAYAAGYDLRNGAVQPTRLLNMSHPYAAGALCMSVPDYLRWQAALTGGRVVKPATYALMSASDTLLNGKPTAYGFGLAPSAAGAHRGVTHNGAVNGFNAEQTWYPDDSLRVVVFTNTVGAGSGMLERNLANAVFGLPLATPPAKVVGLPISVAERAKYLGTYDLKRADGGIFTVRLFEENDQLMTQAEGPGQGKIPLLYLGNDTFGASFDPSLRLTILLEGGVAKGARLEQRGNRMEGVRRN
jgi:D-alanyl-D-alanine carboxypeptidase